MTEKVIEGVQVARRSIGARVALVAAVVVGLFGVGTAAYAEPTESGVESLFSEATTTLTDTLIPAVVGIVLIGALFWLGIRWFQKGKNAGNR